MNDRSTEEKNLFVIAGTPFRDFPQPPSDQPGSELVKCPQCNKKMWLSKKKRQMILSMNDLFVACWYCILEMQFNGDFKDAEIRAFNI